MGLKENRERVTSRRVGHWRVSPHPSQKVLSARAGSRLHSGDVLPRTCQSGRGCAVERGAGIWPSWRSLKVCAWTLPTAEKTTKSGTWQS